MPFLFKLKKPRNAIGGFAFFDYAERLSIGTAWEFYGPKNGASSRAQLERLIARNRGGRTVGAADAIGCIVLSEPCFLPPDEWIPIPETWSPQIVAGAYYAMDEPVGARLWRDIGERLALRSAAFSAAPFGGFGAPTLHVPRRGQGTFRKLVLAAYDNRCAVTGERTVPVLQASHIKPFADVTAHEVRNGLSLRSDLHALFDRGYVTVDPSYRFRVSRSIREEFENGRDYYALDGREIRLPANAGDHPLQEHLEWHATEIFKG